MAQQWLDGVSAVMPVSTTQRHVLTYVVAYRVSPQGVWPYIAAKIVSNTLLATGYGAVILLFTVGPRAGTLPVLGLVALAALLLSALGLAVSVFFEDLSGFLYPAITLFLAFGLPVTAYFFPALQVPGMELIPSYPLAFGIRELLFPTGKIGFYLPMSLTLAAEAAVFLVASARAVELQEGQGRRERCLIAG
jgi:ABC-2 type transport system permease protein/fluoroquinolone transport system permease protein